MIAFKTSAYSIRNVCSNFSSQKSYMSHLIRTSDHLDKKDLLDLFSKNIMALRVPNFCSQLVIDHAFQRLKTYKVVDYQNAEGVGRFDVGMAYFEAENEEQKAKYYQKKLPAFQTIRQIFDPYLSPVDKVRVILDEQWSHGSSLLNLGKGPMFVGLMRSIQKEILPHEDKLERDDPLALSKIHYTAQLAFNCYLAMPLSGGALQLWDLSLEDSKYDQLRGKSYGIDRSLLPEPSALVEPKIGELVIFNPRCLHAVTPINEAYQNRITISGFILYQGSDKPLHLWS